MQCRVISRLMEAAPVAGASGRKKPIRMYMLQCVETGRLYFVRKPRRNKQGNEDKAPLACVGHTLRTTTAPCTHGVNAQDLTTTVGVGALELLAFFDAWPSAHACNVAVNQSIKPQPW